MDSTKIYLLCTNLLLLAGGIWLIGVGASLMFDTERVLLSRLVNSSLPNPLFYYLSLALIGYGLLLSITALLGCVVSKNENYCVFSIYLFSLILLLVGESVVIILSLVCPQYLGLTLENQETLDSWQRNYGVPGKEQYTLAVDLIQTKLECCGALGGNDYVTSWWNLRELAAPNLIVPLSCCTQGDSKSFLDPVPINSTLCQDKNVDNYRTARYIEGCFKVLQTWLEDHVYLAMSAIFGILLYQLLLLLVSIFTCVKCVHSKK